MMSVRRRNFEDLVSSVGAAYPDKQVVITGEVSGYLSFPFAPELATHDHINPPKIYFAKEAQMGAHAN